MQGYKILSKQIFSSGKYSLVPIRFEDRFDIMKWRNEQIYHLRQSKPLTLEDQETYFEHVVAKLFDQDCPSQLLFSFLEGEICIGYGGLVHINWVDNNAEISFIINTSKEDSFLKYWELFLSLIKILAFKELNLHKIFTYSFDVRPNLNVVLLNCGFQQESRLIEHSKVNEVYTDVLYHSFLNPKHYLISRLAELDDMLLFFNWVNDEHVRINSLNNNLINYTDHQQWFRNKINDENCRIHVYLNKFNIPIGQIRIEFIDNEWVINYSIDKNYRQLGLGNLFIKDILAKYPNKKFKAFVKTNNIASIRIFQNIGFSELSNQNNVITFITYT